MSKIVTVLLHGCHVFRLCRAAFAIAAIRRRATLRAMFGLDPTIFWFVFLVTIFAGFVKGAVGFAMPMIMMSAFASVLRPEQALAALILPTLVTNVLQAGRQGIGAAWGSVKRYRWHIGMVALFILVSAPLVRVVPQGLMYLLLGVPITGFAPPTGAMAGVELVKPKAISEVAVRIHAISVRSLASRVRSAARRFLGSAGPSTIGPPLVLAPSGGVDQSGKSIGTRKAARIPAMAS